jgi:hypothetical protein
MTFKKSFFNTLFASLLLVGLAACEKEVNEDIVTPAEAVKFATNNLTGTYSITSNPNTQYVIPVGFTTVSNVDRTVQLEYTVTGGMARGTHFDAPETITIPAGQATANLVVVGKYGAFPAGVTQTLTVKVKGGDAVVASYNNTYTLKMQKYCDVDINAFTGTYTAQDYYNGAPDGGPYTVTITPGTATGTTGFVTMAGLWGVATPEVKVNMDWTDASAFKTTIPTAPWYTHGTYGQVTIKADGNGTFSSCNNTITISYEATVSAGSFGKYKTTLTK